MRAVELERGVGVAGHEVVGEGEPHPEHPGELGRVAGGAEEPDLGHVADARDGGDVVVGMAVGELAAEEPDQLGELAREVLVGERLDRAPQRSGRDPVGARRAADAEVDAAGVQRLEHPELLGDHQWHVVGEHHAAGADADPFGLRRQRRREHRGGGARDPRHVVVLGDPVAVIAEALGRAREVDGARQRLGVAGALADDRQVEHGELRSVVHRNLLLSVLFHALLLTFTTFFFFYPFFFFFKKKLISNKTHYHPQSRKAALSLKWRCGP